MHENRPFLFFKEACNCPEISNRIFFSEIIYGNLLGHVKEVLPPTSQIVIIIGNINIILIINIYVVKSLFASNFVSLTVTNSLKIKTC